MAIIKHPVDINERSCLATLDHTQAAESVVALIALLDKRGGHTGVQVAIQSLYFSDKKIAGSSANNRIRALPSNRYTPKTPIPYLMISGPSVEIQDIEQRLNEVAAQHGCKSLENSVRYNYGGDLARLYIDMTSVIEHPEETKRWIQEELQGGKSKIVSEPICPIEHLMPGNHDGLKKFISWQMEDMKERAYDTTAPEPAGPNHAGQAAKKPENLQR